MRRIDENDFYGQGWDFPPSFDVEEAGIRMSRGVDDINKSIQIIITTRLGERIMRPKFGCGMDDFVFESIDSATLTFIEDMIRTAIVYHEARIDVEEINLDLDGGSGKLLISIYYKLRQENSRFNFVFPYYINEANNSI